MAVFADELENFYRNCVVKGKKITNDCKDHNYPGLRKRICRCNSDRCNAADVSSPALLCTLAAAALTICLTARG